MFSRLQVGEPDPFRSREGSKPISLVVPRLPDICGRLGLSSMRPHRLWSGSEISRRGAFQKNEASDSHGYQRPKILRMVSCFFFFFFQIFSIFFFSRAPELTTNKQKKIQFRVQSTGAGERRTCSRRRIEEGLDTLSGRRRAFIKRERN